MQVLKIMRSSRWEMNIAEIRNTVLAAVKLTFTVGCSRVWNTLKAVSLLPINPLHGDLSTP